MLQDLTVNPLPAKLGRKYGKDYPKVQAAIRALDGSWARVLSKGQSITIMVDSELIKVLPDEVEILPIPYEGYSVVEGYNLMVGVYTMITEELGSEGLARDIVRRIQALRKDVNFNIDDHIETYYGGDPEVEEVFEDEAEYIQSETLSDALIRGDAPEDAAIQEYEIDGLKVRLGLLKIG